MEIHSKKRRLEKTAVACPIVYGSCAMWLGKKAEETATHRWTLFIRGPNDENLSSFISHVAFSLHPSFLDPVRVITEAPFEVTEAGWGEFEAGIRIFFRDPEEQPIDLNHVIKLYHQPPLPPLSLKKPVMSEVYDEIVFMEPYEDFHKQLMQYSKPRVPPKGGMSEFYTVFDPEADLQQLTFIADHLSKEIDAAKMKLMRLDTDILQIQTALSCQAAAISAANNAQISSVVAATPSTTSAKPEVTPVSVQASGPTPSATKPAASATSTVSVSVVSPPPPPPAPSSTSVSSSSSSSSSSATAKAANSSSVETVSASISSAPASTAGHVSAPSALGKDGGEPRDRNMSKRAAAAAAAATLKASLLSRSLFAANAAAAAAAAKAISSTGGSGPNSQDEASASNG